MQKPLTYLRLYVNPAWRREEKEVFSPLLFPFWGNPVTESHIFAKELYDSFSYDTRYYGITDDITKADMVFAPYRQQWLMRHDPALLVECAKTAKRAGLPLLVDGVSDGEHPLGITDAYILRIGGYRFLREEHKKINLPSYLQWDPTPRIEIPTLADDLLLRCAGGELRVRSKGKGKPVVGFAGMVKEPPKNLYRTTRTFIKTSLTRLPLYVRGGNYPAMDQGIFWRRRALRILGRSNKIVCKFTGRDFYSGGSLEANAGVRLKQLQREFVKTILESDYALDVRGYANASVRLYEILSLGRIPVIIDTERIFPFSDAIDWRTFSLIVDFRDIGRLPEIVADFHNSLSPAQFEAMQRAARDAFVHHFRVDAQMPHILQELNRLRPFDS